MDRKVKLRVPMLFDLLLEWMEKEYGKSDTIGSNIFTWKGLLVIIIFRSTVPLVPGFETTESDTIIHVGETDVSMLTGGPGYEFPKGSGYEFPKGSLEREADRRKKWTLADAADPDFFDKIKSFINR